MRCDTSIVVTHTKKSGALSNMLTSVGGLNRKLTLVLLLVSVLTSTLLLLLFYNNYQMQLQKERSQASRQVNMLLQASLENAMLKRDLPGLQEILDRLGAQQGVVDVAVLNPDGEVRFSAEQKGLGVLFEPALAKLCPNCDGDLRQAEATTHFLTEPDGRKILRSVHPVRNRAACKSCHGTVEDNPVNGIFVVDYDAASITEKARSGLLGLVAAGLAVLLSAVLSMWWFMRRNVIAPVKHLAEVSEALSQGDLAARAELIGKDEFSGLGERFNTMASRLQNSLDQLLEKETYLQALIDAIPDGIRVIDESFSVVNANHAYRQLLKLSPDKSVNQPCYRMSHNRDAPCPPTLITCTVYELLGQGKTSIKTMQDFTASDGSHERVQVFAAPLNVELNGKQRHFVVESIRDLMRDILFSQEQKLSALGQLAAGVGHEIRNPLSSIRLALKSTLHKLEEDKLDAVQIGKYLHLVDGEIDKCIDITERLLKLSALSGEHLQLVDVNKAIEETASLLRYEGEQLGIDLELDLDVTQPRVLAAESDIRMLILNLIQNAHHAMLNSGKLKIESRLSDGEVSISFTDNGVGIAAEHKAYIFDPFFSHRADGVHGTGLGLTICQSIVQRHKGRIEVEDVLPKGATFKVILPEAGNSGENQDETGKPSE
ncbi:MAG TPA: HAMP domain-containing protein [Thiotrichales bacterium]|nr:HAMP domain-containing protein [Thiotrichales bacterium]